MREAKKRGRKPKYSTEEERMEAHKRAQKKLYLKKHGKPPELEPQTDKALWLVVEKLKDDVEKIKWELFGRKM